MVVCLTLLNYVRCIVVVRISFPMIDFYVIESDRTLCLLRSYVIWYRIKCCVGSICVCVFAVLRRFISMMTLRVSRFILSYMIAVSVFVLWHGTLCICQLIWCVGYWAVLSYSMMCDVIVFFVHDHSVLYCFGCCALVVPYVNIFSPPLITHSLILSCFPFLFISVCCCVVTVLSCHAIQYPAAPFHFISYYIISYAWF